MESNGTSVILFMCVAYVNNNASEWRKKKMRKQPI